MNKKSALFFTLVIIGAGFSGCTSDNESASTGHEEESKISDLDNQIEEQISAINNLSKYLNESNDNVIRLTNLLANNSASTEELSNKLQENLTKIYQLKSEITQLNQEIANLQAQSVVDIGDNNSPKFLVITIDVEAGSKCGLELENETIDSIDNCIYGRAGNKTAGIIEMIEVADEINVTLSFFVDVMEIYRHGEKMVQVMQEIDSRGHDVQLHFHPSMITSEYWDIIQNTEEWNNSNATRETFMSCWTQETADFWFAHTMEIFDNANISRPIAFRGGAYRYCDTVIKAMGNNNMTQSYNYNPLTSNQNWSAGHLYNFEWENGIMELPITYVPDEDGRLRSIERIDESTWTINDVNSTFDRFFESQSSTRVMTMILHSFSFMSRDSSDNYVVEDYDKLNNFRGFMLNLSEEYVIVSASELQTYIDDGTVNSEFKFPLSFIENECHRNDATHTH